MSAFIDPMFPPLVIDDELLLAMYELELSTAPRQDQPPRALPRTALDGVPRPSQRCPEGEDDSRASESSVHGTGPARVYSRSPPIDRKPDGAPDTEQLAGVRPNRNSDAPPQDWQKGIGLVRKTLLSIQLDDEQVDDLVAALGAYRDHFVELIELNSEAIGPHARENDTQWQNKVSQVQEMIDQFNESLYGAGTGHVRVNVSQDVPHAAA